jgi:alkylation response protein AidB-like acyl-CoA dehydrogenase
MSLELGARTPAGARLVALAGELAAELAEHAGEHDRAGTFPHEGVERLRRAGWFAACIPQEHGGLGVTSVHDVVVASSRLARGDASVAIGANMHHAALLNVVRRWQVATAAGDERRAAAFATSMADVVARDVVMASAISEPGQDLTRPATRATALDGGGWRIDGRKVFCTMSPAATMLYTSVTYQNGSGPRYAYAMVPRDTPGVVVHDDWDALGMRASGSNSVSFEDVRLPPAAVRGGFPAGEALPYVERNLPAGLLHAAASLGVAESAWHHVREGFAARGVPEAGAGRGLAAAIAIELAAARALLSRAAGAIDDHHAAHPAELGEKDDILTLFAEAQAAKAFVCEAAARIVDRALVLSGGAGYRATSPLARAVRDVRAGAFMHPLGGTRATDVLGALAVGAEPALH